MANRHLHINHEDRVRLGLESIDEIEIKVGNEKSAILKNVKIKEIQKGVLEVHLDTDDANANLLKTGDEVELIF